MEQVNRKQKSTLRQRQAQATQELIVKAAQELFLQRGYVASTVEEIAARSGVAVSTVYFAFGSKRAILRAIRQRWHRQSHIKEVLEQARSRASVGEKLALLAHGTRRQWETGLAMTQIYRAAASADQEAAKELREALRGRRAALDGFVAEIAPSLRAGLNVTKAAAILRALCRVEVYEELVQESGWSTDAYEQWLTSALKSQLLANQGSAD